MYYKNMHADMKSISLVIVKMIIIIIKQPIVKLMQESYSSFSEIWLKILIFENWKSYAPCRC